MSKHKGDTQKSSRRDIRNKPLPGFYTPFRDLDQHLTPNFSKDGGQQAFPGKKTAEKEPLPIELPTEGDDDFLFKKAMSGVAPLAGELQGKAPLRPAQRKPPRFLEQEELESYTKLVNLVAGDGPFELSSSDEYTDGAVLGISPEVLKKLREGYFSYQDHLDLHGLNRQEARCEVTAFIMDSFALKRRCVLIIPGRGLNSKDKEPVLKNNLVAWLTRAPLKRVVLAFASARSYDGGWGAFYVLLRKNEGKAPLITPAP